MNFIARLKRLGIRFELNARRYPLVVFQGAVAVLHHDYTTYSAALLIGAWFASRMFHHALVTDIDLDMKFKVVRFLKRFAQCEFTPIPIESVISEETVAALLSRSIFLRPALMVWEKRLRRWMRRPTLETSVLQKMRVFHVARGRSATKPCPVAFTMRIGGYVFLTEKAANIGAVQRFFLLHELGHLSLLSKYTSLRATFGCASFFPITVWVIPQLAPGGLAVALVITFWFFLFILRDFIWSAVRSVGRVFDEMGADLFGLTHLTPAERLEVADFFSERPLPDDDMLPPDGNSRRRKLLADNLEHIVECNGEPEGLFGFPQPAKTEWPVVACFVAIFVLAVFASPATFVSVWILAFIAVTLTFPLTFNVSANRALQSVIADALGGPASVPADRIRDWPEEPAWLGKIRGWLGLTPELPSHAPKWLRGGI